MIKLRDCHSISFWLRWGINLANFSSPLTKSISYVHLGSKFRLETKKSKFLYKNSYHHIFLDWISNTYLGSKAYVKGLDQVRAWYTGLELEIRGSSSIKLDSTSSVAHPVYYYNGVSLLGRPDNETPQREIRYRGVRTCYRAGTFVYT